MKRPSPAVLVLGMLTAVQAGIGLWRIGVMYQEGLSKGFQPFELSAGLMEEIGLVALLAVAAWWVLPPGERRGAAWGVRFLGIAWLLAIGQLVWALYAGYFERGVSWGILLLLFGWGILRRARLAPPPDERPRSRKPFHPAVAGAVLFWILQLPHLFFPYHWKDTREIWACRAAAFDVFGTLYGIFDCLDPGRPPVHSILLWLGYTNETIEGRLLPFLMVGAFGLVLYHFLRQVAPRLAPWGILWFFMTVRIYQGAVSSYADVPVMLAIGIGMFVALSNDLVSSRGEAVLLGLIAGAAAALIKRDGGALIVVATAVLWWFLPRRRDPRLYAALAGAAIGFALWSIRPESLAVPSVFDLRIGATEVSEVPPVPVEVAALEPVPLVAVQDTTGVTLQTYLTMFYGMQGQMLSHYGFGMFVPLWVILGVWVWRRRERLSQEGRLFTWMAVLGWLGIVGIYVIHVSTGHPYRGSLGVIRTAFGRHLVHTFVFAILSATALAEVLLARAKAEPPNPAAR